LKENPEIVDKFQLGNTDRAVLDKEVKGTFMFEFNP
jgi:hypothetical protein